MPKRRDQKPIVGFGPCFWKRGLSGKRPDSKRRETEGIIAELYHTLVAKGGPDLLRRGFLFRKLMRPIAFCKEDR